MDGSDFDALARSLTATGSRRQALAAVLIGALSLVRGGFSVQEAEAKKKKCPPCKKRKRGKCKGKKPDGTVCGPDQVCAGGACVVPACGAGGPCRVFLSSTLHDGNLGGLSGADAKCQGLATSAGLPGTYKAWLSDSTSSPSSRFVPSTGPYRLVNGTTIAANWTDLTDGTLLAPISVTETGGGIGPTRVPWTHTKIDGSPGGLHNVHCSNWSTNAAAVQGDVGRAVNSDSLWTDYSVFFCDTFRHLYCFQQR
jgi:hypothetical protein